MAKEKVVQLKDKQGNNLYPVAADSNKEVIINPYAPGTILVSAQNNKGNSTASSGWDFQNAVCYSDGQWTQYGQMKQTTKPYVLKITVPEGEHWTVYIEYNFPKCYTSDDGRWFTMGIAKLPNENWSDANNKYYASSIFQLAGAHGWSKHTSGEVFRLDPGSHWFALYIFTSGGNVRVYGNGNGTSITDTWDHGPAMTFTAYLVDRMVDSEATERQWRLFYEQ